MASIEIRNSTPSAMDSGQRMALGMLVGFAPVLILIWVFTRRR